MTDETSGEIKRFKTEDGREGFIAPISDTLLKYVFDDGDMIIVRKFKDKEGE